MASMLRFQPSSSTKDDRVGQLDTFVKRVIKGGHGASRKRDKGWRQNKVGGKVYGGVNVDGDINNINALQWHRKKYGRNDTTTSYTTVPQPDNVIHQARYYTCGKDTIGVKKQHEIIRHVTGTDTSLLQSARERRGAIWKKFMNGDSCNDAKDYALLDMVDLINKFHVQLAVEPLEDDEMESYDVLTSSDTYIEAMKQLILLLQCSHVLEPSGDISILKRMSKRIMSASGTESDMSDDNVETELESKKRKAAVTQQPKLRRTRRSFSSSADDNEEEKEEEEEVVTDGRPSEPTFDLSIFDKGVLEKLWFDDHNTWEVGRRELVLQCAMKNVPLSVVNHALNKWYGSEGATDKKVIIYSIFEYNSIKKLPLTIKTRLSYNFDAIRERIRKETPAWHPWPLQTDKQLIQWVSDGHHYIRGEQLVRMYERGDRDQVMTYAAAAIIRHAIFAFNISLSSFPAMLAVFAVLCIGRPLMTKEFFSVRTIRNHIMRLCIIDAYFLSKKYEDTFLAKQRFGYKRFFYTSTDDTKHGKHYNSHVVIRTGDAGFDEGDEKNDGFYINPFFDCISTRQSVSKDNKSNAHHNVEVLQEHCTNDEVFAHYNGNTSDNAAESEAVETEKICQEYFIDNAKGDLNEVYGILKKHIVHMDPFHCCNLAIQHCSEKGLGETDKGNSRQIHHRQCMQALHDIVICDPDMAQSICDQVLKEYESPEGLLKYTIKTMRERMQRWLVNGRNAKHILEGFDLYLHDAPSNFWVCWATKYLPLVTGWKKTVLEEIIRYFMMDDIIVALQFEAELVDYFEVTYQWHAYPGELCTLPGFRTMELHNLLFDFIIPFWESARTNPEDRFPKTYARIKKMEEKSRDKHDDLLNDKAMLKRDQIMFGIQAGYDEISKLYQRLLKAPMIFLAVMDPEKGPSIFRAILAIVSEAELDINRADKQYDDPQSHYASNVPSENLEWGDFLYEGEDTRPVEEQKWYDWLVEDKDMLVHWFQQLGWCRSVILDELKMLSSEREVHPKRKADSSTRLRDFFSVYPIIFTSLRAVFALLPSASRIVESAHGIMRHSYDPQVPAEYTNGKMRYMMNKGYQMNAARRKYIRELTAEANSQAEQPKKRKAAKHSDRKETVEMLGKQLMELIELYSPDKIAALPDNIQRKIKIGRINKMDAKIQETELLRKKNERAEGVRARRDESRGEVDLEVFGQEARQQTTQHDKDFEMGAGSRDHTNFLKKKVLTKTYWRDISIVPTNIFKTDVFRVFPEFESDAAWGVGKTKMLENSKSGEAYDLGKYMELIKKLSEDREGKVKNTINDKDLSDMSEADILREFIHIDDAVHRQNATVANDAKKTKLKNIFGMFGTNPSDRTRYTAEYAYAAQREREDEEQDDVEME